MALAHQMTADTARVTTLHVLAPREAAAAAPMSDAEFTAMLLAMPMPGDDAPLPIRLCWRFVRLAAIEQESVIDNYCDYIDNLCHAGRLDPGMTMDEAIADGRFRIEPLSMSHWPYYTITPSYDHPSNPPVRSWDTYDWDEFRRRQRGTPLATALNRSGLEDD